MVKHNKAIDCNQINKDRHPFFKTWLNQAARKQRRSRAREEKLVANGGKSPLGTLRPFVNCPGQKYNSKLRAGRGFTVEELNAVGLNVTSARQIKIAVDLRRVSANSEVFNRNVDRLKNYLSKLVVITNKSKAGKNGCGIPADTLASQFTSSNFVTKINNKPVKTSNVLVQ